MQRIVQLIILAWIISYGCVCHANTFNFKPVGSLPTSIQPGQTVIATYNVTSAGNFPPQKYHVILAALSHPSYVTQDLTVTAACTLNPINSSGCILTLNIVGAVSGPVKICDDWKGRPGVNCYIPANPNDLLNVTADLSPLLTVSPPTTTLAANASQIFTVFNTSTTTAALNVTMTIPSNVQAQLAGQPVYSGCRSIAPQGSCTVTITASASPSPQSGIAPVQGTNTASPAPTVAINTGSVPALTVSPPTTVLGSNASQVFTVVNTSTTTAALNVTITIPSNVQAQLSGSPVYSGCTSIAALGSCTVTITAVASPSAASGSATVQGTNTALPAPTVAITTGAAPALTVSPSTTILGPNGSQQFVVVNTSATVTALNVTITIPANVQTQLLGAPVYNGCSSIAPLGTCTVTITAVASPNAQSGTATVQGTNTAAPAPTVAITTGAAPVLTVSPQSANLAPSASTVFTVTNTGTIPANNITMTIAANVQAQLTALPVYSSGCTSLPASSSSCTITIQAVASPSGQSGTGTVQGTNTAAPSPVVSIFVLPTCAVLGNSTVTNTGNSVITGAVCVSPGTAITGFPPGVTVPGGQFHTNDSIAVADQSDATTLYNVISGLPCGTDLTGADLGGLTLLPGVYCFSSSAALNGTLTLSGSVTDKWYFQIGTTLTTGTSAVVTLTGGAVSGNVYWQIGSSGTFGTNTAFAGQVVAFTSLTLNGGVSESGRMWARNGAVTLSNNAIGP